MGYNDSRQGRNTFTSEPREMHKAICSECKKECEVPFKPSNGPDGKPRPVFCKECYAKKKPRRY
jgi:CxxC-x17-CxxC domain-containing protein